MKYSVWCVLTVMLWGCAPEEVAQEVETLSSHQPPQRQIPEDLERYERLPVSASGPACGGACEEGYYTPCTCGQEDPCGWREDNVCDQVCDKLLPRPFDDQEDCPAPACTMTICLAGAVNQQTYSNTILADLCERPEIPGLIPDCDKSPCYSTFNNFFQSLDWSVYPALFEALDTNSDGLIDEEDQECELNIVGFSWGGVNAVELSQKLIDDPKIAWSRSFVDRLVIIDPYQPLGSRFMEVPWRVRKMRSFRRSVAPEGDCSGESFWGPYVGLPVRCQADADCQEFDYSLAPDTLFPTYDGGSLYGDEVGHCSVLRVAHEPALHEILDLDYEGLLPPRVYTQVP